MVEGEPPRRDQRRRYFPPPRVESPNFQAKRGRSWTALLRESCVALGSADLLGGAVSAVGVEAVENWVAAAAELALKQGQKMILWKAWAVGREKKSVLGALVPQQEVGGRVGWECFRPKDLSWKQVVGGPVCLSSPRVRVVIAPFEPRTQRGRLLQILADSLLLD